MSARPGAGFQASRAWAASTMPGVQYPHCSACAWQNASWTLLSPPSGPPAPSIVVTLWPSACAARMRQDRTGSPSSRTVQQPQTPCSQPRRVPVKCRPSRNRSARLVRPAASQARSSPLTISSIRCLVPIGCYPAPGAPASTGAAGPPSAAEIAVAASTVQSRSAPKRSGPKRCSGMHNPTDATTRPV